MSHNLRNDPPARWRVQPRSGVREGPAIGATGGKATAARPMPDEVPQWRAKTRELWFRNRRLRRPSRKRAPLEEFLLAAIQAVGWQEHLVNPFQQGGSNDCHEQLTKAVRRVNASIELDWLRLHVAAGGVCWEDRFAQSGAPAEAAGTSNH